MYIVVILYRCEFAYMHIYTISILYNILQYNSNNLVWTDWLKPCWRKFKRSCLSEMMALWLCDSATRKFDCDSRIWRTWRQDFSSSWRIRQLWILNFENCWKKSKY